jgi:hypothetical protein
MASLESFAVAMGALLALGRPNNRTAGFFFSGLLVFWGVFLLFYTRGRPDRVQGLTLKQVRWCSVGMIMGGVVTAIIGLFE